MSTLETNAIGKYSGNNVSVDDSLNLKSYTTTQRDALTSAAGDMIYNTSDSKPQFYNGSAWTNFQDTPELLVEYIVVAGGGALLRGIDRLIAEETGLPVHIADDPLTAVAEGTGRVLQELQFLKRVASSSRT